mmetsp:Transcript_7296/g.19498  ORF Transcript_7296/g.19498 Transcript_7296/m.19498 type:complete len:302 (+) Transcript_7296:166-1071(+)
MQLRFFEEDGRAVGDGSVRRNPLGSIVFPAVSVGNVPQLAVDLLVHTLSEPRERPIGAVHSDAVLACVGAAEFVNAEAPESASKKVPRLSPCLELFSVPASDDSTFAVLQQRAPVLQGMASAFASDMVKMFVEHGVNQAVLLLSSNAAGRRDVHMRNAFRFMTTSSMAETELGRKVHMSEHLQVMEGFGPLGWCPETARGSVPTDDEVDSVTQPRFFAAMRTGAYVRTLLEQCEAAGLALLVLVSFVHEGDNAGDAIRFAELACDLLNIPRRTSVSSSPNSWMFPPSWACVLGPPPVSELY